MRIKNFLRFINEDLNPQAITDESPLSSSRQGQTHFFDRDEFSEEEWQPTGDLPRKQKPDTGDDFEYDDYYPQEDDEADDEDLHDEKNIKGQDSQPFISDTDDEPEESDRDYIY